MHQRFHRLEFCQDTPILEKKYPNKNERWQTGPL
jgi:hypothetical protein